MSVKILAVAATETEASVLKREEFRELFVGGDSELVVLVTGVGSIATSWEMQKWFGSGNSCDLAFNLGIAGSFNEDIAIGEVVMPVSDCFADAGIEDGEHFYTLFETGLADPDLFPFSGGRIYSDETLRLRLNELVKPVSAITVGTSTGSLVTREKLISKFSPDIETMEGATFFYLCKGFGIPFFALRAISNRVEARNRENWDIKTALRNLGDSIYNILPKLT